MPNLGYILQVNGSGSGRTYTLTTYGGYDAITSKNVITNTGTISTPILSTIEAPPVVDGRVNELEWVINNTTLSSTLALDMYNHYMHVYVGNSTILGPVINDAVVLNLSNHADFSGSVTNHANIGLDHSEITGSILNYGKILDNSTSNISGSLENQGILLVDTSSEVTGNIANAGTIVNLGNIYTDITGGGSFQNGQYVYTHRITGGSGFYYSDYPSFYRGTLHGNILDTASGSSVYNTKHSTILLNVSASGAESTVFNNGEIDGTIYVTGDNSTVTLGENSDANGVTLSGANDILNIYASAQQHLTKFGVTRGDSSTTIHLQGASGIGDLTSFSANWNSVGGIVVDAGADWASHYAGLETGVTVAGTFANDSTMTGGVELTPGSNFTNTGILEDANSAYAVFLHGTGSFAITNNAGGVIAGNASNGAGIAGYTGGAGTTYDITNFGTIEGLSGVHLVGDGIASITNYGTIESNAAGGTAIRIGSYGHLAMAPTAEIIGKVTGGGNDTLELMAGGATGTIAQFAASYSGFNTIAVDANAAWQFASGGTVGNGVDIIDAGTLTNNGVMDSRVDVYSGGGFTNAGTVAADIGVYLHNGASSTVTNAAGALIEGGANGAGIASYTNAAQSTHVVTNNGTITAGRGIVLTDQGAGTVTNNGTIIGGNGTAIALGNGNDTVILAASAVTDGAIDGGGGTNTLELAGGAGIGNLSTSPVENFSRIMVDAGAQWQEGAGYSIDAASIDIAGSFTNAGTLDSALRVETGGSFINSGTVASTIAVYLANGAASSVLNLAGGVISGSSAGIASYTNSAGSTHTITNYGTIAGGHGIALTDQGANTVYDYGAITGTNNDAIEFGAGNDTLVLGNGATVTGGVSGGDGANRLEFLFGAETLGAGDVQGFSSITADAGANITFGARSTLAAANGISLAGAASIANAGTIDLGAQGLALNTGQALDNLSGGVISGTGYGVQFLGSAGATLTDAGTITGAGGTAVQFGAGNDRLVLQGNVAFGGAVHGGGGANTLELAAGAGSLAGLGTNLTGFAAIAVDAGASWDLTGNAQVTSGVTLTNAGTIEGALTVDAHGVLSGGSFDQAQITVQGAANNLSVTYGGVEGVVVSSGGVLSGGTIGIGTNADILSGGVASGVTVNNAGLELAGGIARASFIVSGGHLDISAGGIASTTTLAADGLLTVSSGGTASSTTISAGGTLDVLSGGQAFGVTDTGGAVEVLGGTVSGLTVSNAGAGGVIVSNGTLAGSTIDFGTNANIQAGGTATGLTVNSAGLEVAAQGTALATTISAGGHLDLASGGLTSGISVVSGGVENVSGIASATTLHAGGSEIVGLGGSAIATTVSSGGGLTVQAGGYASGTTVMSGGRATAAGGTLDDVAVSRGGSAVASAGGTVEGVVSVGGVATASAGGTLDFLTVSNTGTASIASGGLGHDITVLGGGISVLAGGVASNVTLEFGAASVTGTATDFTFTSGGVLSVGPSGSASNITINAGSAVINGGAVGGLTINRGGISGVTVTSGTLHDSEIDIFTNAIISTGGAAISVTPNDAGLLVKSGGLASASDIISGGHLDISSGGVTRDTTLGADSMETVSAGAHAYSTHIMSGGTQYVSGVADGSVASAGGTLLVYGGGLASGAEIAAGGTLVLELGGTVQDLLLDAGATLDLAQLTYDPHGTAVFDSATNTLTVTEAGTTMVLGLAGDTAGPYFHLAPGAEGGVEVTEDTAACYYPGTLIRTDTGDKPVEILRPGDIVTTADGRRLPIRWIGRNPVSTRFADPFFVLPIRIKAGALGENLPARDLLVSPEHAVLVDDILVQAAALINGISILRETKVPEIFTYYHVECAEHVLLLAEGVAAESFVDNVTRRVFENWAEYEALHGDRPIAEMNLPRAQSHRQLPPGLRARLAARGLSLFGNQTPRAA